MSDIVDIVLRREKSFFSGLYRLSVAKEYRSIVVDGKRYIPWSDTCWDDIFTNLQVSPDVCRILVTSDTPLSQSELPLAAGGVAGWELREIAELVKRKPASPSGWVLNGVHLNGRLRNLFPCDPAGSRDIRYIYTIPKILPKEPMDEPEEGNSPWDILRKMEPLDKP